MKKIFILLFLAFIIFAQETPPAEESFEKAKTEAEFFDVEQEILTLRKQINSLQEEVSLRNKKINMPIIREEIKKFVKIPILTHEVVLANGTIVKGELINENVDLIILQTQIGELKLLRSQIKSITNIQNILPKLSINGPINEQTFANKKIFSGTIVNDGDQRADFVRIHFSLFKENTNLINADSAFVFGNKMKFVSGIYSIASIKPGQTANFRCVVPFNNATVSYYTKEIKYELFE